MEVIQRISGPAAIKFLFLSIVLSIAVGQKVKHLAFCKRGFQVAELYHECWEQAMEARPFGQLFETQEVYDAAFLEKYAVHMCSRVKPLAIRCLRKKVQGCSNTQKLISIADGSGGTCVKNKINPYFKLHIISKLNPVSRDSKCFDVSKKAQSCYVEAGEMIMKGGTNTEGIPYFHKAADKFFDRLWQCMVDMFKSNTDNCPNWQMPMLLTLQRAAMPSLFGMRLNNYQIGMLQLDDRQADRGTDTDKDENCGDIGCPKPKSDKVYILIRVLSEKPEKKDGDVLLELASTSSAHPELGVVGSSAGDVDVRSFLADLMTGNSELTLQQIQQIRENKEVKDHVGSISLPRPHEATLLGRGRTTDENGMVKHPRMIMNRN